MNKRRVISWRIILSTIARRVFCMTVGHSRKVNVRVLVVRKNKSCKVTMRCSRCGKPLQKRIKALTWSWPYFPPASRGHQRAQEVTRH